MKNGKDGILEYASGARYDGEWKNDKADGFGSLYYANNDIYEGEWKNSKKNGRGKYQYADG